jgi:hypothetical protein
MEGRHAWLKRLARVKVPRIDLDNRVLGLNLP